MAALFAVLVSFNLIFANIRHTVASTHWVVTEDGKIQSQVDSVFNMKRPYDLVAFMKQEERASMLDRLKQELLSRKDEIDKTEDRDTGLEEKFYKTDIDCLAAGKHLPDLDLYISTVLPLENKGIKPEDYIPSYQSVPIQMQPDCTLYKNLEYSPYAFEHLEGMKDRKKLPGTPELGLMNAITYKDSVDEYGHRIFEAFKQNKTSWVLFNMAAFYWRIKGDPYNVIECVRRALHYSPRIHRDVALISLANVLHRARYSNEAAIVVHAALDVSKELNVNHFTLGNIYAVLGEYNKSVICFENTLKIQPEFEAAAMRKHAVKCHAKLESALEAQHRSLQQTLNDLKDYQRKHDYWQKQNDKLLAEQVPVEVKLAQHVAYEDIKIKELSTEIGEYCKMGDRDGKQVLMCSWGRPIMSIGSLTPEANIAPRLAQPVVEAPTEEHQDPRPDYSKPVRGHMFTIETVKGPKQYEGPKEYLKESWPTKDECDLHVQKVPDARNLTSTYLPPENKGFDVKPLLTEAIGLKPGDEHPLPWYPPVCVTLLDIPEGNDKSFDDVHSISYDQRTKIPLKLYDPFHKLTLLQLVNNGKVTIEEIGQRILTGLKENVNPKWILFNLAGLYWRIIGNNYHGIECFRRAIYTAPQELVDSPITNMANILYRWGRYDDAIRLIHHSMYHNTFEPATMFLLGNINWAQKNYTGAVWRYQQTLEADPHNTEVLNTLRALKCYMKYYQAAQSAAPVEYNSKEGGEEKCVIETRTRTRGECEGTCTQTCTMSPVADTCGGAVEGPEGRKHGGCGSCQPCCTSCHKCGAPTNSCQQPKGPKTVPEDNTLLASDPEECDGEECSINLQSKEQPLHIKIYFQRGELKQKLVYAQSPNEITVAPDECVIYNDNSKSEGCSRPEFKAHILEGDDELQEDEAEQVLLMINGQLNKILPVNLKTDYPGDKIEVNLKEVTVEPVGPERVPPFQESLASSQHHHSSEEEQEVEKTRKEIIQLPDHDLPDTSQYVKKRVQLSQPTVEECQKVKKININLQKFSSTWLSLSAKRINIKDHIDFSRDINKKDHDVPFCTAQPTDTTIIDFLPGIKHKNELEYTAESGLNKVLQKLGGSSESLDVVGSRIAKALKKNETSWVLTNVAALYWRVQGHASRAIDCVRVALHYSPPQVKDIALLSVSNIFHRAGYINDAIVANSFCLAITTGLVVEHFNMANLYSAKGDWDNATLFYESTLGLQSTFEPARQRLQTIQCMKVQHDYYTQT